MFKQFVPPNGLKVSVKAHGTTAIRGYCIVLENDLLTWKFDTWLESDIAPLEMPRSGTMGNTFVTPEESELITGLYYPASMDRLREMVYESRVLVEGE